MLFSEFPSRECQVWLEVAEPFQGVRDQRQSEKGYEHTAWIPSLPCRRRSLPQIRLGRIMTPKSDGRSADCLRVGDDTSASRSLSTLLRYRQLRITSVPAIRSELTERPYNHSPYTDIEATKRAPHVITSAQTIKLTAYQRNPFIRQIQNPKEASDPHSTTANQSSADDLGGWGRVGLLIGFAPNTPTAIAATKNRR